MWYAFTMDDGNIGKAPTKKELLLKLSGSLKQRCKRHRKGMYSLEEKDDDGVWRERAYIYGSKKLSLLDGWSFDKETDKTDDPEQPNAINTLLSKLQAAEGRADTEGWIDADDLETELFS